VLALALAPMLLLLRGLAVMRRMVLLTAQELSAWTVTG